MFSSLFIQSQPFLALIANNSILQQNTNMTKILLIELLCAKTISCLVCSLLLYKIESRQI